VHMTPAFGALLASFDLDALAQRSDTIFGLDADLRLAFFNPAWFAFADANGGAPAVTRDWGLGRCVLDACPDVIREFYAHALTAVLQQDRRWDHDYECSSPDLKRIMRLSAYPLRGRQGLLVVNALVVEAPIEASATSRAVFDPAVYADGHGIVHQCANCRKVRRTNGSRQWDWVPALVAGRHPMISHDLCELCLDFYYPAPNNDPGRPDQR
jgi:hypothetical protein